MDYITQLFSLKVDFSTISSHGMTASPGIVPGRMQDLCCFLASWGFRTSRPVNITERNQSEGLIASSQMSYYLQGSPIEPVIADTKDLLKGSWPGNEKQ